MSEASDCGGNSPLYSHRTGSEDSDGSNAIGLAQYPQVSAAAAESAFISSINQSSSSSNVQVRSWKLVGVLNGYKDAVTCKFRDRLPEHFVLDMNPPPFSTTCLQLCHRIKEKIHVPNTFTLHLRGWDPVFKKFVHLNAASLDDTLDHIYRCTIENRQVNAAGKLRKECSINVSLDFAAFDKLCENEAKHKQARSKKSRERKKVTRKVEHFKKFFLDKYKEEPSQREIDVFMAGKSTFQRPASPDPELRLFSVKAAPAVSPKPLPVSSSIAPSSITSHRARFTTSDSTTSAKRQRSPSPPTRRRGKLVNIAPSQPAPSRGRSRERASNESQHHQVPFQSEPRSLSPPPILPDLQNLQKAHVPPTRAVGPFDEGRDTVLFTHPDPLRGHFVKTPGAWYETRSHFPMPRRHWGRSDSFSPPPGPNRHLEPTRESFKSPRGANDEELRINQYYWDMIKTRDRDLVTYEGNCFRCSKCWFFKWPWRFPEKQPVSMSADDRLCQRCITQGKRTALLRQSEGLSHDKTLLNFDSSKK